MTRADQPTIDAETAPWWDAAREARLLVRRCDDCRRAHLYPRPFCPACWSEHVSWEQASGAATLYTYSVVRFNDLPPFAERVPYLAAVVDLAEGPRMMTNLVDCTPEQVLIGMPLTVAFRTEPDGPSVPVFRPTSVEESP
jgi:uncharacterized OB-fold protein